MDQCLDIDIFGRQIKLTFRGKDKFRTRFGTICTLIIIIILLSYMAFHIPDMMEYRNALPVISPITREMFAEHYSQE